MLRRDALKLLAGAVALPLLSRDALALFQEAQDQLPAKAALRTLNPHQDAIVSTMAELIIPKTQTPGATDVRVNQFIDLILTEWYDADERDSFLTGLAGVDSLSRNLYARDFVECQPAQQSAILATLDEQFTEARQASMHPGRRGRRIQPEHNFFFMIKQLTLVGYYTSEAGFEDELHDEIIPSHHAGCEPLPQQEPKGEN